ncbi:MAG TPA: CDP-alcohol phosphatidyltransferase family protein [Terracidiphilus sp.]|jgi:phosphatidylglycerophosphate synthase|nr:CDP-alcohol phosphatidyltransferase family protein [Terracidiphilus sp.]
MLPTKLLTYRSIRREFQTHSVPEEILVDHYTKAVSPVFTRFLVRWKVIPNSVTACMILSGALGAGLFALPWLASKIAGLVLIHLWFILDCSDGEVARITRRFSAFGTEMDYLAHAINHPLFNLSFAWSLVALHRYSSSAILACALVSISAEMLLRHLTALTYSYRKGCGEALVEGARRSAPRIWAISLAGIFSLYPNFALLFPILFLIDKFAGTPLAPIYFAAQTAFSLLISARLALRWIRILRPA